MKHTHAQFIPVQRYTDDDYSPETEHQIFALKIENGRYDVKKQKRKKNWSKIN